MYEKKIGILEIIDHTMTVKNAEHTDKQRLHICGNGLRKKQYKGDPVATKMLSKKNNK